MFSVICQQVRGYLSRLHKRKTLIQHGLVRYRQGLSKPKWPLAMWLDFCAPPPCNLSPPFTAVPAPPCAHLSPRRPTRIFSTFLHGLLPDASRLDGLLLLSMTRTLTGRTARPRRRYCQMDVILSTGLWSWRSQKANLLETRSQTVTSKHLLRWLAGLTSRFSEFIFVLFC